MGYFSIFSMAKRFKFCDNPTITLQSNGTLDKMLSYFLIKAILEAERMFAEGLN